MKDKIIISRILFALIIAVLVSSCKKDTVDALIVPLIVPDQTNIQVGYQAGKVKVNVESNVIFYATVDNASKNWLKYQFTDSCKNLIISYLENTDTTSSRTGYVTVSKGSVSEVLTVLQKKASPPRIRRELDIAFQTTGSNLTISAEECAKIPLGSIVVIESSSETGSFQLSGFNEISGNLSKGKFSFVWTAKMDSIRAAKGLTGILGNGFKPSVVYASFVKKSHKWVDASSVNFNGKTFYFLDILAEETSTIPIGATMVVKCPVNVGAFIIGFSTHLNPIDGKVTFPWTKNLINDKGVAEFIRTDGFEVSDIYSISFKVDLLPEIKENGSNTSLTLSAAETAYIPIGATVVIKCADNQGTININGFGSLTGNPVDGEFTFKWTAAMRNAGELAATISGGSKPTSMFCRN
jgi:hypothetical protein